MNINEVSSNRAMAAEIAKLTNDLLQRRETNSRPRVARRDNGGKPRFAGIGSRIDEDS
jgi:hypothetical protein